MTITTGSEVRFQGGFTDEFSNDEIEAEIDLVEAELYARYLLPKRSSFSIDDDYTNFYVYEDTVHEITRLQVSVDSSIDPSGWLTVATGSTTWSHTTPNNYITLNSDFITTYDNKSVRVRQVPKVFNMLATNQVALNLMKIVSVVDGDDVDIPKITRLQSNIKRYKEIIMPKGFHKSSTNEQYDRFEYISYNQSELRN